MNAPLSESSQLCLWWLNPEELSTDGVWDDSLVTRDLKLENSATIPWQEDSGFRLPCLSSGEPVRVRNGMGDSQTKGGGRYYEFSQWARHDSLHCMPFLVCAPAGNTSWKVTFQHFYLAHRPLFIISDAIFKCGELLRQTLHFWILLKTGKICQ